MSKIKKPPKIEGVKEVSRDPVLKTNCAFIRVAETGMLGANGKSVMTLGFGGRMVAEPDKPMELALSACQLVSDVARWSTDEARRADVKAFVERIVKWGEAELAE